MASILYGGTVDANHGYTPFGHGTHDLGMAFDLGLREHILGGKPNAQTNSGEALNPDIAKATLADPENAWSKANAIQLLALLPNDRGVPTKAYPSGAPDNDQQSALKNFLALYDITQKGNTGSRDALKAQIHSVGNKDKIIDALFGDGTKTGGPVSQVLIGGGTIDKKTGKLVTIHGQNPYHSIRAVLDRLGIKNAPADSHHTHFHIYLQPPAPKEFGQNLVAELGENAVNDQHMEVARVVNDPFDVSYNEDPVSGESTMLLSMLVPYLPPSAETTQAPSAPILVAQATTASPKPDMTLSNCVDTQTPDNPGGQLGGVLTPAGALVNYWSEKFHKKLSVSDVKVTILKGPEHGKITGEWKSKTSGASFVYEPNSGFLGKDKVTFLVEGDGKRVKIVTTVIVVDQVGLDGGPCFSVKRIGGTDTPGLSTEPTDWLRLSQLSDLMADWSGVEIRFAQLPDAAVGRAEGEGDHTVILLDDNAAGHGWFIDSTPLDHTDEFLPTSDPSAWIAKAGSAAGGKIDMLSVLLHEYGHALGLDHSHDARDFMAATLQLGERRLPSTDELALMSQLVAQLKQADAGSLPPTTPSTPSPFDPSLPPGAGFGFLALGRLRRGDYGMRSGR